MSKRFNGMFKVCMFFAVFAFAAAAIPAAAAYEAAPKQDGDAAVRQVFVDSMTIGLVKGLQLSGKEVSPEQQAKLRGIAEEFFPRIYARIKAAGFGEDYKKQMFDPEIRQFDRQMLETKTVQEVSPLAQKQMKIFHDKYPKLFEFMNTDPELQAAAMDMLRKISEALK